MRAPFAPPRLSVPRNVDAAAQAVDAIGTQGHGKPANGAGLAVLGFHFEGCALGFDVQPGVGQ